MEIAKFSEAQKKFIYIDQITALYTVKEGEAKLKYVTIY